MILTIDIFCLIHFAAFILDLGVISFILIKNPSSSVNKLCAILILTFALWSFAYGFLSLSNSADTAIFWVTLAFIGGIIQPVAAYYLFMSICRKNKLIKNRLILAMIFSCTGILILIQVFGNQIFIAGQTSTGWIALPTRSTFYWIFLLFCQVIFFTSIYSLIVFGFKTTVYREKLQVRWLIISSLISLVLGTLSNSILPLMNSGSYAHLGDIPYLVWETGLIVAVVGYGLMSLSPQSAAKEILSTMSDSLFLLDNQGNVKQINQATLELLKQPQNQIIGRKFDTFIQIPIAIDKLLEDTSKKGKLSNYEFVYNSEEGHRITLLISISAVRDKQNLNLGFVLVARDITERELLITNLRTLYLKEIEQRKELEEEAKARGMFIDILAHELRTPLTPMLNSISILNDIVEDDSHGKVKKLIKIVHLSSQTLLQKLEELLDLARYSKGTFKIYPKPCELKELFEKITMIFQASLNSNDHDFVVEISDNLPIVNLDPTRLEQVINNLLSNAQKYNSPRGGIYFSAKIRDDALKIEIKDDGPGIPEDEIENVFKPYHRIQQDRQIPGLGLGLTICKQIVEAHNGKISIESKIGNGCKFCISIPVTRAEYINLQI